MIAFSFLLNSRALLISHGLSLPPLSAFPQGKMLSSPISGTAFVEKGTEEGAKPAADCPAEASAVQRTRGCRCGYHCLSLSSWWPVGRCADPSYVAKCDCIFSSRLCPSEWSPQEVMEVVCANHIFEILW